jgi:ubiquinone/menaquinone biosynthesis C-methylase UbiE
MTPNNTLTEAQGPHVCPHQFAFFLDNWLRRLIQHPKKIVGPYIKPGDTVIDMGCGPGYFTIDMAKMVGSRGRVVAVDIQEKMLAHVRKKARRHGVAQRLDYLLVGAQDSGLSQQADFILAFYMIHETPDVQQTFKAFERLLKNNGKILAVEPKMHAKQPAFEEMLSEAEKAGLSAIEFPKFMGSRSVVFRAS